MDSVPGGTLFPTIVVGSLPRPQWIRELIEERTAGDIGLADADRLLDDAVLSAIRLQERAGLDFISDGEWRRSHYCRVFTEAVAGFVPGLVPTSGARIGERRAAPSGSFDPGVVARMEPERPIATTEAAFLRDHTDSRIMVALPSPYTLGRRMWSAEHSSAAYPTREGFMEAIVPIIRREIEELARLGVDAVQLDNPWPAIDVDPRLADSTAPPAADWATSQEEIAADLEREADLCARCINGATEGIEGVFLNMHICHTRGHTSRASYDAIFGVLGRMNVHRYALEFATPDAGVTEVLADFPEDKILGLGVIHPFDTAVEPVEQVVGLVERAMRFVPKERISLNSNCGFAPGAGSARPRAGGPKPFNTIVELDDAYLKLRAMCQAAAVLRERHG